MNEAGKLRYFIDTAVAGGDRYSLTYYQIMAIIKSICLKI
jgi:hypothetical protein